MQTEIINTMQTEINPQITFEDIKSLMRDKYYLHEVDYRQEFNNIEIIEKSINKRDMQPIFNEIQEWVTDDFSGIDFVENEIKESIRDKYDFEDGEEEEIWDKFEDEITTEIYNRDKSNPIKDILKNTSSVPVLISLYSNYDCINSHWFESQSPFEYQESYLGAIIDAMNINPQKIKQFFVGKGYECSGKWPNKKNRDGKEFISLEHFQTEFINSCCGGNLFVILGRLDLEDFMKNDGFTKVIIPKENQFGFYSTGEGGGSCFEGVLLKPMEIDLEKTGATKYDCWSISVDSGNYSMKRCYGASNDFFGGNIELKK